MTGIIIVAVFLFALHRFGRLGPFAWQGREHLAAARTAGQLGARPIGPQLPATPTPSEVLARRLADGDISPEEYLERSALLHER